MRITSVVALSVLGSLLALGCSSSTTGGGGGTEVDSGTKAVDSGSGVTDTGTGFVDTGTISTSDTGTISTADTGTVTDTGGSTTPDSAAAAYTTASQCPSATPICCQTIPLTGGSVPNCTNGPLTVACETSAACPTTLGLSCSGNQVVRLCSSNSDCTESNYNLCCNFPGGDAGASLSFCANQLDALGGGGTCM